MTTMKMAGAVAKAADGWIPAKHPRGRDGKFIETMSFVQVFDGPSGPQIASGRVTASYLGPDGRIHIGVDVGAGKVEWYRPKQIQTVDVKAHVPSAPSVKATDSGLLPDQPLPSVSSMVDEIKWDDAPMFDPDYTHNEALAELYGWPTAVNDWNTWLNIPDIPTDVYTDKAGKQIYAVDANDHSDAPTAKVYSTEDGSYVGEASLSAEDSSNFILLESAHYGKPKEEADYAEPWDHPDSWKSWLMSVGQDPSSQVFVSGTDANKVLVNNGVEAFVYQNGHMAFGLKQSTAVSIASQYGLAFDGAADPEPAASTDPDPMYGWPEPNDLAWVDWLAKAGYDNPQMAMVAVDMSNGKAWVAYGDSNQALQRDMFGNPTGLTMHVNDLVENAMTGNLTMVWDDPDGNLSNGPDFTDFGVDEDSPDVVATPAAPAAPVAELKPDASVHVGDLELNPGDTLWKHPQGATIVEFNDGSIVKIGPDGKAKKTTADAFKLQQGYGNWKLAGQVIQAPQELVGTPGDYATLVMPDGEGTKSVTAKYNADTKSYEYWGDTYPAPDADWEEQLLTPDPAKLTTDESFEGAAVYKHNVMPLDDADGYFLYHIDGHNSDEAQVYASVGESMYKYNPNLMEWAPTTMSVEGFKSVAAMDEKNGSKNQIYPAKLNGMTMVSDEGKAAISFKPGDPLKTSEVGGPLDGATGYFIGDSGLTYGIIGNNLWRWSVASKKWTNLAEPAGKLDGMNGLHAFYNPVTGKVQSNDVVPEPEPAPTVFGAPPVSSVYVNKPLAGVADQYWLVSAPGGEPIAYAVAHGAVFAWTGSKWQISVTPADWFTSGDTGADVLPASYNAGAGKVESDKKIGAAPAPAAAAPAIKVPKGQTPKSMLTMISVSFANKNPDDPTAVGNFAVQLEDALNSPTYDSALKALSKLMTAAKLGGKQRARYKALLQMHYNVAPAPGSSPKSAVIGDPGKWRPVEAPKQNAIAISGVTSLDAGSKIVQSGGNSAGTAKANIQENLTRRIAGRVTTQQILDSVLATQNDVNSNLTMLAQMLVAAMKPGYDHTKLDFGYVAPAHAGVWAKTNGGKGALPATRENLERAVMESVVSTLVSTWAATSNDSNPRALAMQHAAEVEFGLKETHGWSQAKAQAQAEYAKNGALYREFLRVMYENTQEWAKENGITKVRLRRGQAASTAPAGSYAGKEIVAQYRPMSSFSSATGTAEGFGPYVVDAIVPIEWIIGNAATGFGCRGEYEWVILGGKHKVRRVK